MSHQCAASRREKALEGEGSYYYQKMVEMEKNLETSVKLFPLLKDRFIHCKDSFVAVMADWDKSRVQLVQLREKVIQLDAWQERKREVGSTTGRGSLE